jgi:hypothetical protein
LHMASFVLTITSVTGGCRESIMEFLRAMYALDPAVMRELPQLSQRIFAPSWSSVMALSMGILSRSILKGTHTVPAAHFARFGVADSSRPGLALHGITAPAVQGFF